MALLRPGKALAGGAAALADWQQRVVIFR